MRIIVLILFSLLSISTWAQITKEEKKGDKLYFNYSFKTAIEKYKASDTLSIGGKRRLADSYFKVGQYEQSENSYSELVRLKDATTDDIYNYASVLRRNGKSTLADTWMKKFCEMLPYDSRSKKYYSDVKKLEVLMKDDGKYKVSNLDINTDHQDFGPAYYLGKMAFTSTREDIKSVKRSYNWNGLPFLDMYVADMNKEQLVNPEQLSKELNNNMHEGPACFTADGNTMAFTCNNYTRKSKDGVTNLQILFSEKNSKGEWGKIIYFRVNNSDYSVAYPWLNKDGTVMYFSSDLPGGYGGADIYRIEKNPFGGWKDPVNVGKPINTEGDELFPFFHEEKEALFFSSNGHLGIGGLDLFMASKNTEGTFYNLRNFGSPINTRFDDFGLIINETIKQGYFSSNREGGKGDDDIYFFEIKKPIVFEKLIRGIAKDSKGVTLAGLTVALYDENGKLVGTCQTSMVGEYKFIMEPNKDFTIVAYAQDEAYANDYYKYSASVSTKSDKNEITLDIIVQKK